MKVVIPGGSGQVGTILARVFVESGDEVVVLSRGGAKGDVPWRVVEWDGKTLGGWQREIDGADVVINLAGRSVDCRYNAANRRAMMDSRVDSTHVIGEAIGRVDEPPGVWLQASTATIYAHSFEQANDEVSGTIGGDEPGAPKKWNYSIEVAKAWEAAAMEADTPGTRKVLLRSAMVMSPDRGGIFDVLLGLVRKGLGGTCGNGKQYVSWVHHEDFVRAAAWLIEHEEVEGAVNVCSPEPVPNARFMRELRQAWGARIGLPATAWMLEMGAVLLRTETELVLKSRRVVPGRLVEGGCVFEQPEWVEAARELCAAWRTRNAK